jgi:hypothetical protein
MNDETAVQMDAASLFIRDNSVAVREFISRARQLSASVWLTPRASDKWSPCQEAQHLILALGFFSEAVLGQREIALEVSPERSQRLYAMVIPKLRAGEALPTGARSPADADPTRAAPDASEDRDSVLQKLAARGDGFEAALVQATAADPLRRVQHPYFGLLSLEEFGIVAAAHTRHHMRFLPTIAAPEPPRSPSIGT